MKRLVILTLIISMLLILVSCGKSDSSSNGQNANNNSSATNSVTSKDDAPAEAPNETPEDTEALIEMAKQVVFALAYGKIDEADINTLYSHEEQWNLLFPDSEGPQTYYGYTFENMDDLSQQVISLLIVSENEGFTITVTDATISFCNDVSYSEYLGKAPEAQLVTIDDMNIENAARVTLSLLITDGEEATSSMEVYFVKIDGQWKAFSPTIAGFFLEAFTPTQVETIEKEEIQ